MRKRSTFFTLWPLLLLALPTAQAQVSVNGNTVYVDPVTQQFGVGTDAVADPNARMAVVDGRVDITPSPNLNQALLFHNEEAGNSIFRHIGSLGGTGLLTDLSPEPSAVNGYAYASFFRQTNTTGRSALLLYRGDAGVGLSSRISVDGNHSFFNRNGGNVGIGLATPTTRLDINGNLTVGHEGDNSTIFLNANNDRSASIGVQDDSDSGFFVSTGGAYRMHVTQTGNVGIGTNTPATRLDVNGNLSVGNEGDNSAIIFNANNGRSASIGVQDDSDSGFYIRTNGAYRMHVRQDGRVGFGTTNVPDGYRVGINGRLICEEVRVELSQNWPDYVFHSGYQLTPLLELEKQIQEQGHLPNIPSAKEVEEEGISLGAMQAKMMEKIEELTLYVIDLKKENEALKQEVEALK